MSLDYQYKGALDLEKASETELKLYNALIWATMVTGINCITEKNLEEFTFRVNFTRVIKIPVTTDQVRPFIGLFTNANTLTRKQWETGQGKILYRRRVEEITVENK